MSEPVLSPIILYDIPSRPPCRSWSINAWKIRLLLNYKSIPYKTTWLEYPDIAPTFQSFNIPPNPPSLNPFAEYSIPAIRLSDGRFIMDSFAIAAELDTLHPQPPLYVDSSLTADTKAIVMKCIRPLFAVATLRVAEMLLNVDARPGYEAWFLASREKVVGLSREEFARADVQSVWVRVEEGLGELRAMLEQDDKGPFVMGGTVSFADFVIAAMWIFLERLDRDGDLYGRFMSVDKRFREHYDACREWMVRDDH